MEDGEIVHGREDGKVVLDGADNFKNSYDMQTFCYITKVSVPQVFVSNSRVEGGINVMDGV